jgi:dTDP-4-amino-4,6-dideoxygalactose transaminase
MYYLVFPSLQERTAAIKRLKESEISAVFHYLSLHKSPFFADKHDGRELPLTDHYSDSLLRLPFYNELTDVEQESIIKALNNIH